MKLEVIKTDNLVSFEGNPRQISEDALKRLEKSIKNYGFTNPILAWKHNGKVEVVCGHQRLKAAKMAGMADVPVIILPFEDEMTAHAYNVADNRLGELSEWDLPKLKDLLGELDNGGLDIELTGFSELEIESLMTQFYNGHDEPKESKVSKQVKCPKCGHEFESK